MSSLSSSTSPLTSRASSTSRPSACARVRPSVSPSCFSMASLPCTTTTFSTATSSPPTSSSRARACSRSPTLASRASTPTARRPRPRTSRTRIRWQRAGTARPSSSSARGATALAWTCGLLAPSSRMCLLMLRPSLATTTLTNSSASSASWAPPLSARGRASRSCRTTPRLHSRTSPRSPSPQSAPTRRPAPSTSSPVCSSTRQTPASRRARQRRNLGSSSIRPRVFLASWPRACPPLTPTPRQRRSLPQRTRLRGPGHRGIRSRQ
mmetsp:Transcript_14381/g.43740  ORF Transcript_14381/g.43740 Transcript_14381/m.43740 type:complete len:266 (-) Transcript_14381:245-1042(-)